jgi:hypothetical protein
VLVGAIVGIVIGLAVAAAAKRTQEQTMRQRFGKDLTYAERERINYERIAGVRGGPHATSSMEYGCVFVALPLIFGVVGAVIGAVVS